ncbi:Eukaryotic-type carbonic anhydrase [Nitzschia inconspicua]|uniref:Eukaryotic-type carbonic anhydrase n=1 Tax=Nitzschia inconspicua TaxID=303405 RepID=A0A9K3KGQ0_9STRA|nr:Eukaryotic-type carbonic anhydrase [Nitzschia inconspicua]
MSRLKHASVRGQGFFDVIKFKILFERVNCQSEEKRMQPTTAATTTTVLLPRLLSLHLLLACDKKVNHVDKRNMKIGVILPAAIGCLSMPTAQAQNDGTRFLDRFTYEDEDILRQDQFYDYAPQNWNSISCNEGSQLDDCLGYTDKWHTGRDWSITKNYCRWCPDGEGKCSKHHQSPINLNRAVGYEPGTHPLANECIDVHWMKYEDSTCSMEELVEADAFTIERHALRISQPISVFSDFSQDDDGLVDGVRLNCRVVGLGSRFGRIDFSKGFSQWWHLSHIDVHVPAEHTQDGRTHDAEIQMKHFYSVTAQEAGVENEMATVSIFMNAYEDAAPYRFLDKVICQWRRKEYEVRKECGLDPVNSTYPGCFPLFHRNLRSGEAANTPSSKHHRHIQTAEDVIIHNDQQRNNPSHKNIKIEMDEANFAPAEEKDWDAWILQQSQQLKQEEEFYHRMKHTQYGGQHTDELHEHFRRLHQGDELEWFNYWPLIGVRTEYYFRYSGSQTIPPCYGNHIDNSRSGTNHWRVMKDPIRIHPRQLKELKRLIGERISPKGSLVDECMVDTAAKVTRDSETQEIINIEAARPLQEWNNVHFKTFCECKNWESKWPEDRQWCLIGDISERFFDKPYNFNS